ncbi:hypothetical protein N7495_000055 [Penicillium taxi]|uniref:uncharacterized protein n=1 Tax=Penicillium taxi TaxID=168475 RepID=UPI0025457135|nr:uncharacterized protein N7495_000055 [Penicillium taxi]KAJ5907373.1 hypothetical protein N7495_000055 [Penicillium taxi]
MTPTNYPVPNGTLPFWRTDPHLLDNHRSSETLPQESDIVIIGAGYAGSSVAYHILSQTEPGSKPPSITILEARQACSGATARNGGHMKPDLYNFISTLENDYGVAAAAEVAAFEARHVHEIKEVIEKEAIDCDYEVTKTVDAQFSEEHFDKLKTGISHLIAGGCKPTEKVQIIETEEAQSFSGVKGTVGCFVSDAGHIWAYKFVLHILEKVVSLGVNMQTNTPALKVSKSATPSVSHPWEVETTRGSISAKVVVLATNAYTSGIAPQYQDIIVPVRGTCSRIVVPPGSNAHRLTKTYILRFNSSEYDYLIPRADGSIIVGGARSSFFSDKKSWYDVSDDSKVLEAAIRYFDGYMQRYFVGWENSNAYTDRVWTGIMGNSSDGLPHVGEVPEQEGQYIIAGFTGHGMPQIFFAAEGLAKMIVGGTSFEETGLPRLFKTTSSRIGLRQEAKA